MKLQNRKRLRELENSVSLPMVGEIVREFGVAMYTLLYLQWITKRVYCIAQGTLFNVMWQFSVSEVESGGEWIHVYVWLSQSTVHLKLSGHC